MMLLCAAFGLMCHAALCVDNHPRPRSPDVTYAHMPHKPGYERDHIIPLCLGGPDTRDNLQYQPYPQAYVKDEREKQACEDYCAGPGTRADLEAARAQFYREYP